MLPDIPKTPCSSENALSLPREMGSAAQDCFTNTSYHCGLQRVWRCSHDCRFWGYLVEWLLFSSGKGNQARSQKRSDALFYFFSPKLILPPFLSLPGWIAVSTLCCKNASHAAPKTIWPGLKDDTYRMHLIHTLIFGIYYCRSKYLCSQQIHCVSNLSWPQQSGLSST